MRRRHVIGGLALEANMTPMIDVTFLLLVFFLVGTKFKEQMGNLKANLPKKGGAAEEEIAPVPESVVIRVEQGPDRQQPVYRVGDGACTTLAALEQKLVALKAVIGRETVIIDPDPRVDYGPVLQVLNSCVKLGFQNIAFAAPQSGR